MNISKEGLGINWLTINDHLTVNLNNVIAITNGIKTENAFASNAREVAGVWLDTVSVDGAFVGGEGGHSTYRIFVRNGKGARKLRELFGLADYEIK